jgi:hypothetical protein
MEILLQIPGQNKLSADQPAAERNGAGETQL